MTFRQECVKARRTPRSLGSRGANEGNEGANGIGGGSGTAGLVAKGGTVGVDGRSPKSCGRRRRQWPTRSYWESRSAAELNEDRAVERLRTPIGHGAFAAGLEGAWTLELGAVMDEVWPALLGLPPSREPVASSGAESLELSPSTAFTQRTGRRNA